MRLLQIDAPELGANECYGRGALRELQRRLQPGDAVVLAVGSSARRGRPLSAAAPLCARGGHERQPRARPAAAPRRRTSGAACAVVMRRRCSTRSRGSERRAPRHVGRVHGLWSPDRQVDTRYVVGVPRPRDTPNLHAGPSGRRFWTSSGRCTQPITVNCDLTAEIHEIREGGAAMTAAQFELIDETEAEAILRWRFEELVRSGYDVGSALVLASHVEVDLHDGFGAPAPGLSSRDCTADPPLARRKARAGPRCGGGSGPLGRRARGQAGSRSTRRRVHSTRGEQRVRCAGARGTKRVPLQEPQRAHGAVNAVHVWVDPPMPDWICECASTECMQPVRSDDRRVRSRAGRVDPLLRGSLRRASLARRRARVAPQRALLGRREDGRGGRSQRRSSIRASSLATASASENARLHMANPPAQAGFVAHCLGVVVLYRHRSRHRVPGSAAQKPRARQRRTQEMPRRASTCRGKARKAVTSVPRVAASPSRRAQRACATHASPGACRGALRSRDEADHRCDAEHIAHRGLHRHGALSEEA